MQVHILMKNVSTSRLMAETTPLTRARWQVLWNLSESPGDSSSCNAEAEIGNKYVVVVFYENKQQSKKSFRYDMSRDIFVAGCGWSFSPSSHARKS